MSETVQHIKIASGLKHEEKQDKNNKLKERRR